MRDEMKKVPRLRFRGFQEDDEDPMRNLFFLKTTYQFCFIIFGNIRSKI